MSANTDACKDTHSRTTVSTDTDVSRDTRSGTKVSTNTDVGASTRSGATVSTNTGDGTSTHSGATVSTNTGDGTSTRSRATVSTNTGDGTSTRSRATVSTNTGDGASTHSGVLVLSRKPDQQSESRDERVEEDVQVECIGGEVTETIEETHVTITADGINQDPRASFAENMHTNQLQVFARDAQTLVRGGNSSAGTIEVNQMSSF